MKHYSYITSIYSPEECSVAVEHGSTLMLNCIIMTDMAAEILVDLLIRKK